MSKSKAASLRRLTIRNPHDRSVIAQGLVAPEADEDAALLAIYRKSLGPDAPEQIVLSRAVRLDDEKWDAEISERWGRYQLVVVGPKGDPTLDAARLLMVGFGEPPSGPTNRFPTDRAELTKMLDGRRHDALVPLAPEEALAVGEAVTFVEAAADPFGEPVLVPGGKTITVDLTKVRKEGHKWLNKELYYIAWEPRKPEPKAAARELSRDA